MAQCAVGVAVAPRIGRRRSRTRTVVVADVGITGTGCRARVADTGRVINSPVTVSVDGVSYVTICTTDRKTEGARKARSVVGRMAACCRVRIRVTQRTTG